MAIAMTGRVADGLILQLADPDLIRWFVGQLHEAATAAGRDPASLQVQAAAPAHIGPRDLGRERTRWFPALVSNHVVDLVNKYPREQLPEALTGYITDRTGYDYHHHAEVGSSNAAFVGDEVTDRFCVLGEVDEHIAKLRELADAGVDQFNLYLMNGDEEAAARGLRHGRHPGLPLTVGRRQSLPDGQVLARMSGWSAVPASPRRWTLAPHGSPAVPRPAPEERMTARFESRRRIRSGTMASGARRRNMVQRTEASLALILAIAACGLTAAMWLRQVILPLFGVRHLTHLGRARPTPRRPAHRLPSPS